MVDDKLYRLTIPGAVFVFLFVGWLVADSSIGISFLLTNLKLDNTTKLMGAVFSSGLVVVVVGYLCGEIGLAIRLPDSNIQFAREEVGNGPNKQDEASCSQDRRACMNLAILAVLSVGQVLLLSSRSEHWILIVDWMHGVLSSSDWLAAFLAMGLTIPVIVVIAIIAAIAAFVRPVNITEMVVIVLVALISSFAIIPMIEKAIAFAVTLLMVYLCLVKYKASIDMPTQKDNTAYFNLWRLLHAPSLTPDSVEVDTRYNLEALSVFTHGRVASMDKLYTYISRAWGRIVIGSSSFIAAILAFQTYWLTRILISPSMGSDFIPLFIFFLLNVVFVWVLRRSIKVQQEHRVRLYTILLLDPSTGLRAKDQ